MFQQISKFIKRIKRRSDDDFVDRLNYYYTSSLILIFALLVSAKQYVGSPIECWVPAHFTGAMEEYTENFCWVQNTWFLKLKDVVPTEVLHRQKKEIIYYQWTPFILLLQAILSFAPCFMWRYVNGYTGYDLNGIVKLCINTKSVTDKRKRQESVETIVHFIKDAISGASVPEQRQKCRAVKGCYVTVLYLGTKLLYCVAILLQFLLLNLLLGIKNPFFGWKLLTDLSEGREWQHSGIFPRVTLCDFEVKVMGNVHRYTVQCVLMINMFNEKIFMFLWFWFVFLLIITMLSFASWTTVFIPARRKRFLRKHLLISEHIFNDGDYNLVTQFVLRYLAQDGFFALCLIQAHGGCIVTSQVISELWNHYRGCCFVDDSLAEFDPTEDEIIKFRPKFMAERSGFLETIDEENGQPPTDTRKIGFVVQPAESAYTKLVESKPEDHMNVPGQSKGGIARGSLRKEDRMMIRKHRSGMLSLRRMIR